MTFWFTEQRHYPFIKTLVGHGLSSAREGEGRLLDTSGNLANARYALLGIGLTTASSLLWDVGIVGTLAAFGILGAAFVQAGRLARRRGSGAYQCGLFEGIQATIALVALSFFHKNYFTFHLGYQVFVLTLLGFVVWASRRIDRPVSADRQSSEPRTIAAVRDQRPSALA